MRSDADVLGLMLLPLALLGFLSIVFTCGDILLGFFISVGV